MMILLYEGEKKQLKPDEVIASTPKNNPRGPGRPPEHVHTFQTA